MTHTLCRCTQCNWTALYRTERPANGYERRFGASVAVLHPGPCPLCEGRVERLSGPLVELPEDFREDDT